MAVLFTQFVYNPIYNLLIFVYNLIPVQDFGIAIILVTIIIKLLLIPLSKKQIESQRKMQELQPKIKEIQAKYKQDKEKQSRALMEFYRENKANPFSGCLPLIFQLIFLIAIYRVLFNISSSGLMVDGTGLYFFVENPGQINHLFLNLIDLSKIIDFGKFDFPSVVQLFLVVVTAVAQYLQTKILMAKKQTKKQEEKEKKSSKEADFSEILTKQMLYIGPLMTLVIGIKFPAGLTLNWLVSTLFMIAQQYYLQGKEEKKEAVLPVGTK